MQSGSLGPDCSYIIMAQTNISLYIHIPFCLSKCPYCNFNSVLWQQSYWEGFVKAVYEQAKALRRQIGKRPCSTVYLGGGTPSIVSPDDLRRLIELVDRSFDIDSAGEFTLEANPRDITIERLKKWRSLGVNRLSIGVQSFSEETLKTLGRDHNAAQSLRSVKLAQDVFGDRVSIDLMFAVPGEGITEWQEDLLEAMELGLKHISLYCLTIERQTQFYYRYRDLDLSEISACMYRLADEVLSNYGLFWYEISNFALPGYESQHNLCYWLGGEFIGLGPGGWSFVNGERFAVDMSVKEYINFGCKGKFSYCYDRLAELNRKKELAVLRLRTKYGIPAAMVFSEWEQKIQRFLDCRWISEKVQKDKRYFVLTLEGRLFADEIAVELL